MYIEKKQVQKDRYRHQMVYCMRAREALKLFLSCYNREDYCLFLPAFIGFSPNEGSGIYDPVTELGMNHRFYQMDINLEISLDDLKKQFSMWNGNKILLLVHYWGYVDPNYEAVVACAHENNCIVIEDMAHAIFTEYVDRRCGYSGDASFYSFHKMFPMKAGGALKIKTPRLFQKHLTSVNDIRFPIEYDFVDISNKRKQNAKLWESLLEKHPDKFKILRPANDFSENTPQTFPVRILCEDRFRIYSEMNNLGYGLISLYHTMISPLRDVQYENARQLSAQILNFPVHQDVTEEQILNMYDSLIKLL